ncbi:MAG: helix-turn-helix domain-containing protein [Arthrobacter sp.]|jgi:transcriptional regulator with XRE-family HTH domain|nr:helix-turn-helix domain-containing protein [Arthrobacter sp.]
MVLKALPVEPSNQPLAIGAKLRAARQAAHMTMDQTAEAAGITKGFLSRVERDLTSPSVASLVTLCQVLSLPIGELFAAPNIQLTRLADTPRISLGGDGIVERLITPRSEDRVQVLHATIEAHGRGESEQYTIDCDLEVLHISRGQLRVFIGTETFDLDTGDTLTFPGREPHTWENPSDEEAQAYWTLIPAASR